MAEKIRQLLQNSIFATHRYILIFAFLLIAFAGYTIFLSFNLNPYVIPDETYHFEVSKHFATTWGLPENIPVAQAVGKSVNQNSYLGYWINGRMQAVFLLFFPTATDWQSLVFLRIINALFSWGTVIITYLIAKEFIRNKWLQLLPVFMLTNTLMFVFLSAGVNHDNPAIFFSSISLLYFIKTLKHKEFINNSLAWMIFICVACLIKYSVLPLALVMGVIWIIYLIKNKPELTMKLLTNKTRLALLVISFVFIALNFSIFGMNIIRYRSIIPSCTDIYSKEICEASSFAVRHQEMALPEKLSVKEAFRQGDPEPIRYVFDYWIRAMLDRIFGIMGHKIYFPISVSYFLMLIFLSIGLGMRYIRKPNFLLVSLFSIIIFYALVLVRMNYNSELVYGFHTSVALQGRYIFPVITIAYVIWGYIIEKVSNKLIRFTTLLIIITLFFYGGPIRFILYYHSVFADWFI
ncbi:MAG TPA: phospholipid carrier-dependent glycosyltransferase [Brevefilum sp.]|nr:phospholipid carrier-dependent glycosyltransferase [Brevefilum sp.]